LPVKNSTQLSSHLDKLPASLVFDPSATFFWADNVTVLALAGDPGDDARRPQNEADYCWAKDKLI
jgi:hypothetical protein